MSDRLPSTGRRPSLGPDRIQALLEAYYGEDSPSLKELRLRFHVTNSKGVERPLSLATVRKYLKAAGVTLPRGKAAVKEASEGRKAPCSIRTLMNHISTEELIGAGTVEYICRLLERGESSQKALATRFGISERRVRALRASIRSDAEPEAPETVEAAPAEAEEETPEVNILDLPESEETPEETPEETEEA